VSYKRKRLNKDIILYLCLITILAIPKIRWQLVHVLSTVSTFLITLTYQENQPSTSNTKNKSLLLQQELTQLQGTLSELLKSKRIITFAKHFNKRYSKVQTALAAAIMNRSYTPYEHSFLVNKGTKHGVRKGMIILSPDNTILGRVENSYAWYSKVIALSDHRITIPVCDETGSIHGIAHGAHTVPPSLHIRYLTHQSTLSLPLTLLSSGQTVAYPAGFKVGNLTILTPRPHGYEGEITLSSTPQQYTYCLIISPEELHT